MIASLDPLPTGDKSVAKYRQISSHLRTLIQNGKLKPGTRLPGMIALAKQWETNYFTLHSALTPLENEGLIERTPRGTFVRNCSTQITSVAIYYGCDPWDDTEGSFFQQLCRELQGEFEERKINSRLFIDSRQRSRQFSSMTDLVKAIQRCEIHGLLGLMLNAEDVRWLQELGIPLTLLFNEGPLHPDNTQAYSEGLVLDRLAADGCKTVGMIIRTSDDLYPAFENLARTRGLRTDPAWVKHLSGPVNCRSEAFGYQSFKEIWSQPHRPDGLYVSPDWACRGVITAILELGVRIPQDLRLILYRNTGLDYLCPWQVPMIAADVGKTAQLLVDRLLAHSRSGSVDPFVSLSPVELVG